MASLPQGKGMYCGVVSFGTGCGRASMLEKNLIRSGVPPGQNGIGYCPPIE